MMMMRRRRRRRRNREYPTLSEIEPRLPRAIRQRCDPSMVLVTPPVKGDQGDTSLLTALTQRLSYKGGGLLVAAVLLAEVDELGTNVLRKTRGGGECDTCEEWSV